LTRRRVLVAGASGLIGRSAVEVFASAPDWDVVGLSRRAPHLVEAPHVPVDLLDPAATAKTLAAWPPPTHLVYCALQESPGLVPGWHDRAMMETNRRMLENLLDALEPGSALEHVSLLQGTKAYGAHLHPMRVPGRERTARDPHDNFYWLQEDLLRERAERAGFGFTIWRPPVVYGHAIGSPMNPLAAIGTFAAISRAEGRPLCWPGGASGVYDAVDARLLGRAFLWAAEAASARDRIFNVTNGDVFVWEHVWAVIAGTLGMEPGEPEPLRLAESMPKQADRWAKLVEEHELRAPALMEWVGDSFLYVDMLFNSGRGEPSPPSLLSTIELRQAGFVDCIDTEDMLVEWLEWMQAQRLLPTARGLS